MTENTLRGAKFANGGSCYFIIDLTRHPEEIERRGAKFANRYKGIAGSGIEINSDNVARREEIDFWRSCRRYAFGKRKGRSRWAPHTRVREINYKAQKAIQRTHWRWKLIWAGNALFRIC